MQYVMLQQFQSKIDALEPGADFTIPSLLGAAWENEQDGAQIGKDFKQAVQSSEIRGVKIIDANSNPARYQKRV